MLRAICLSSLAILLLIAFVYPFFDKAEQVQASKEVRVTAAPGSKILYWASEPALESLTKINDWRHAYQKYENAGVTTADETGVAILKVRPPQPYVVPWKGRLEPHVHFRICGENGMLGRVKTVFVKDGRVEGFSAY